ncbi:hypothetical protein [Pseudoclavibacter sp. AY1F1]|nr:hypothetical protein [Pseudoclavibacter sp. AY1F1]
MLDALSVQSVSTLLVPCGTQTGFDSLENTTKGPDMPVFVR